MNTFDFTTLRERFEETAGGLPARDRSQPPACRVLSETDCGSYIRRHIQYDAHPGIEVPAYLLLPKVDSPCPAALALHPTIDCGKDDVVGLSGRPNRNYAEELARLGYAVLAPDYPYYGGLAAMRKPWNWSVLAPIYPYFGESLPSPFDLGFAGGTMLGIWNHLRGLDLLFALPQVDRSKCVAIGHSLGGHNALFAALFDERIGAVVTSCGFTRLPRYKGGDIKPLGQDCYMPRIVSRYSGRAEKLPWDFDEILSFLAPRGVFVCAPEHDDNFDVTGVRECIATAAPYYEAHRCTHHLEAAFPSCGHDFPPEARFAAYRFLGRFFGLPEVPGESILNIQPIHQ